MISTIQGTASRLETPSAEHVKGYRQQARMMSNEEIHSAITDYEYILLGHDDDEYPDTVNAHSHLNALAAIAGYRAELSWRASKGITKPTTSLGWPKAFLDDLKARVSIESQVEQIVTLRRRGASLVGSCPFHDDKNPSLVVWPDSGRFKCFGCQVGGDVLTWAQAANRMEFRDAVHLIAAYAGVDVPKKTTVTTVTPASGSFDYVNGKVVPR